jgi:hypothetical protein
MHGAFQVFGKFAVLVGRPTSTGRAQCKVKNPVKFDWAGENILLRFDLGERGGATREKRKRLLVGFVRHGPSLFL